EPVTMATIPADTRFAARGTGTGRLRAVGKALREAPLAAVVILGGLILVAVLADLIAPYDPTLPGKGAEMFAPPVWLDGGSRAIRGEVLTLRERAFVKLAEIAGASKLRVIKKHILPNVMNTATVLASLTVGVVIIAEASLSFLGVGVPPPQPAWGLMLSEARPTLMTGQWWLTVFPGACILLIVLATQLFGDWLRVRLDP